MVKHLASKVRDLWLDSHMNTTPPLLFLFSFLYIKKSRYIYMHTRNHLLNTSVNSLEELKLETFLVSFPGFYFNQVFQSCSLIRNFALV